MVPIVQCTKLLTKSFEKWSILIAFLTEVTIFRQFNAILAVNTLISKSYVNILTL